MKIAVINGTEKHGVTYRLKETFLEPFKETAEITEFYLPRDCAGFCIGCVTCFERGEHLCKDAAQIQAIEKALLRADLIVMTSPAYVMHATGAMKAMLDHFGYRWMPHRPAPEMFGKRAVIITQCLGSGSKSTAKDIKDSLSWWGISQISVFAGALRGDIHWEKLPEKKRAELTSNIEKLSAKYLSVDYQKPARANLGTRFKFIICRMLQKSLYQSHADSYDAAYWKEQGWLDGRKPY